jgi:hypothetical protein
MQLQVESQTQVPCDCQRQRHHPPIGNCNGRGLSAFCLDPCRLVDAGVDSYNDSSRHYQPLEINFIPLSNTDITCSR